MNEQEIQFTLIEKGVAYEIYSLFFRRSFISFGCKSTSRRLLIIMEDK